MGKLLYKMNERKTFSLKFIVCLWEKENLYEK